MAPRKKQFPHVRPTRQHIEMSHQPIRVEVRAPPVDTETLESGLRELVCIWKSLSVSCKTYNARRAYARAAFDAEDLMRRVGRGG